MRGLANEASKKNCFPHHFLERMGGGGGGDRLTSIVCCH